jgi:endonuclease/exonuclease/phosphatase family metal-dependent hydrolase
MRRLMQLLVASAVIVAAQCSSADGEVLRVGQVNLAGWAIYGGHVDAGYDLAEAMAARDLDVVGVSEVCESQVEAAIEVLDGPYDFAFHQTVTADALPWSPPPESGCRYGNALIARGEDALADVEAIELPSADFTTEHEWDPEEDRWALCGRIKGDAAAFVCTLHLTNLEPAPDSRLRQVTALKDIVEARRTNGERAVLIGDFNARIGDRDLSPLDAWKDASRNRGVIHVLVDGFAPVQRGKLDVGRTDHELIWASLELPSS